MYTGLATDKRIIRPANCPPGAPGRGHTSELPQAFEVAEGPVRLDAALIVANGGNASSILTVTVIL